MLLNQWLLLFMFIIFCNTMHKKAPFRGNAAQNGTFREIDKIWQVCVRQ